MTRRNARYVQPWPDAPGKVSYHAVFHDHATFGGHAFSEDGLQWTYSMVVPFSNKVDYTDGDVIILQRRERRVLPFLSFFFFDSGGGVNGVGVL